MIVIAVVFLVFIIIAVDSAVFFGDLVVTNVTAPSTAVKGQEIIIPNTIKNNGILPTMIAMLPSSSLLRKIQRTSYSWAKYALVNFSVVII